MDHGSETYFFSLDFNVAGEALPPGNSGALVAFDPKIVWGVIIFDAFVMNGDRHSGNWSFDTDKKILNIFDHSHAFFGPSGDIATRLSACRNNLAIGGHSMAQSINTEDGRDEWLDRLESLPRYLIAGAIEAAAAVGMPENTLESVTEPPRVCRRPYFLRGRGYDEQDDEQVFT